MKKITVESLDDLDRGIKQLLLENRCSFSEDEIRLFQHCIELIQLFKSKHDKSWAPNWDHIIAVVDILIKIFIAGQS